TSFQNQTAKASKAIYTSACLILKAKTLLIINDTSDFITGPHHDLLLQYLIICIHGRAKEADKLSHDIQLPPKIAHPSKTVKTSCKNRVTRELVVLFFGVENKQFHFSSKMKKNHYCIEKDTIIDKEGQDAGQKNPGERKYGKFIIVSKSPLTKVQTDKTIPHKIPTPKVKVITKYKLMVTHSLTYSPLHHIRPKLLSPLDFPVEK
ncbi:bidirectional sugar transporter SWEET3a, partial [Striga asiatica]